MAENGLKRITIQVEPELFADLERLVKHGFRRHLLEKLIRLALTSIEEEGDIMLGALIAGEYKLVRDHTREAA